METIGSIVNRVKDALIWSADTVEDHPWITIGLLVLMTVVAFAGIVAIVS